MLTAFGCPAREARRLPDAWVKRICRIERLVEFDDIGGGAVDVAEVVLRWVLRPTRT